MKVLIFFFDFLKIYYNVIHVQISEFFSILFSKYTSWT